MLVAILATAVGMLTWLLILRIGQSFTWVLVGSFVAIAISRPATWIERHTPLPRGVACGSLVVALGIILLAVMVPGLDNGATATSTAADELPDVVAELEQTRFVGGWLRDRGAAVWVEDQMNDLPQRLSAVRPATWLPAIGARILDVFWIVLVSVALLIDGPRLIAATTRRVPARHRRQFSRLVGAVGTALGGYAAGAALVASINGGVVFAIALVLGIGLAPMLAVWAFLWNFVPQIGGFMGGLPLILFALVAGPVQVLIATVAFIAYQFIENNLIQPAVIGAAIDVAPWGTLLAALAGAAAAGVVGAIVLTPLVGVVKVIRAEYRRDDFPGATVMRPLRDEGGASEAPTVSDATSADVSPTLMPGLLDTR
jgi:predicted PurR-regulated permease PerM